MISQTVVKKLNGLSVLAPLLRTPKINLQRNTVALVANLAKNPNLCKTIGRRRCGPLTETRWRLTHRDFESAGTRVEDEGTRSPVNNCCGGSRL